MEKVTSSQLYQIQLITGREIAWLPGLTNRSYLPSSLKNRVDLKQSPVLLIPGKEVCLQPLVDRLSRLMPLDYLQPGDHLAEVTR
jgi:hypothetical protein